MVQSLAQKNAPDLCTNPSPHKARLQQVGANIMQFDTSSPILCAEVKELRRATKDLNEPMVTEVGSRSRGCIENIESAGEV